MTGEISSWNLISLYAVYVLFSLTVKQHQLDMDSFLYKADVEGSSLLHMAVDSGSLQVRWKN